LSSTTIRQAPSFQANREPLDCFSREVVHVLALVDGVALVALLPEVLELGEELALEALALELERALQGNLRYHCTSW